MVRFTAWVLVAALVALVPFLAPTTSAQEGATIVASELNSPRSIVALANGNMYVAEAGNGGDEPLEWAPPFGTAMAGHSGKITHVVAGSNKDLVPGIQSVALGPNEAVGPQGLIMVGEWLYATIGQQDPITEGMHTKSLLVRVAGDGEWETVADLGAYESAVDPDGLGADSNPFDVVAGLDGNLYVADAGANALFRVTPTGHISTAAVWGGDNPVPSGVAIDSAGNVYVSFLSHFPFTAGTSRVERWSADGQEVIASGLTAVTDLAFGPDGSLYVLEMSSGFVLDPPPPGFTPNSGRVLRLTDGGPEVVYEGLNFPTKLTFGPDGSLYVNNNSTFSEPGTGQVLLISTIDSED